jgi:ribosome biogenesis GTPase / thiamine phosphate phosphatase
MADGTRIEAIARGRLFDGIVGALVVGDHVVAAEHASQWTIDLVLPRRNEFVREGLRHERQVLFANVDRVLILASLSQPETKTTALDRFLVAALAGQIPPLLALTKIDLDPDQARALELRTVYEGFALPVYPLSNATGEGTEALAAALQAGITGVVGNSGVGKTSLLNRLIPGLEMRVREVSSWSGKGTHTTTASLLVPYAAGALIDTPGMKSFVPWGIQRETLADLFPEIAILAPQCRFRNCRHQNEPDCAVRAAVETGTVAATRLRSYYRLLEQLG